MPSINQEGDELPVTLGVKPYDLVGQGQNGSCEGQISKATCTESVEMGGEKPTKQPNYYCRWC